MTDLRKAAEQALNALLSASTYDERQSAITALRAAMTQPDVPDGWVLVPVEPTEEMLNALGNSWTGVNIATWQRLIAAAPKGGEA